MRPQVRTAPPREERSPMDCLQCGTPVHASGICPKCRPFAVAMEAESPFRRLLRARAFPADPRYDSWLAQRRLVDEHPIPTRLAVLTLHRGNDDRAMLADLKRPAELRTFPLAPRPFDYGTRGEDE